MAKLKNEQKILYSIIAAIAGYAVWLNLPQSAPATSRSAYRSVITSTGQTQLDPADDTNAHFPRYVGSNRDPFIPAVSLNTGTNSTNSQGPMSKWQLTGIDTLNGVTSALVEDSSTQESQSLQVGDSWNGMKVVSIGDDVVNLVNSLGLPVQLGFAAPPDPLSLNAGANLNVPSVNQITPLPPLSPGSGRRALFANAQNGGDQ